MLNLLLALGSFTKNPGAFINNAFAFVNGPGGFINSPGAFINCFGGFINSPGYFINSPDIPYSPSQKLQIKRQTHHATNFGWKTKHFHRNITKTKSKAEG